MKGSHLYAQVVVKTTNWVISRRFYADYCTNMYKKWYYFFMELLLPFLELPTFSFHLEDCAMPVRGNP